MIIFIAENGSFEVKRNNLEHVCEGDALSCDSGASVSLSTFSSPARGLTRLSPRCPRVRALCTRVRTRGHPSTRADVGTDLS